MPQTVPPITTFITDLVVYGGEPGETIRLVTVPYAMIKFPPFQRDQIQSEIKQITAEYDRTAYAFPMVALWEGNLIDLDGLQRLTAAERRYGDDELLVAVQLLEGVRSKERLADLFLRINRDKKLLAPFEKFVAALHAKDRGTVDINRALREYGEDIGKSATPTRLPAGAVMAVHSWPNGPDLLRRMLNVKNQAWGDKPCREANEAKTLLGLASFIRRHWTLIDDQRLITVLRKYHPGYIISAVAQAPPKTTYADYLHTLYNQGMRGKGRLP